MADDHQRDNTNVGTIILTVGDTTLPVMFFMLTGIYQRSVNCFVALVTLLCQYR
jgi:hypothetical protein